MHQAQHIFWKDLRFLRYETTFLVALAAAFIWAGTRRVAPTAGAGPIELLLIATTNFLIARLIHAEAIPGDRQFWVTRPYRWKSLLGAKLAYILIFVHTPILLAHISILIANGFPLVVNLPGLLWSQLLIAAFVSIPVMALAAVTRNTVQFVLAGLVLVAIASASVQSRVPYGQLSLGPVDWVRTSIALLMLLGISLPILHWQYRSRRTFHSRSYLSSGLAIAALLYLAIPWTLAFRVQEWLSKQPFDATVLRASLEPSIRPRLGRIESGQFEVFLPVSVMGIPEAVDLRADAMSVSVKSANGRNYEWMFYELVKNSQIVDGQPTVIFQAMQTVDAKTYEELREGLVNARVGLFLTTFGNSKTRTIPLQEQPVDVMDGLQCFTGASNREGDIFCRSAFRWPARIVDARVAGAGASNFTQFISYSPFPAELRLNPIELRWASAYTSREAPKTREVTITTKEPVAHAHREFSFQGLQIRDLARKR